MECSSRCFPRSVSLGITYWQFSNYQKDLLSAELELDVWDKNVEEKEYEFGFSMVPLSWLGLIIAFAFSLDIFVVLFALLGLVSILISGAFYLNIRQSTRLETPPKFRMSSYISLIMPPALQGVAIGSGPIMLVLWFSYTILYGEFWVDLKSPISVPEIPGMGPNYLMDAWPNHWMEKKTRCCK
jgi:hypothetical protein